VHTRYKFYMVKTTENQTVFVHSAASAIHKLSQIHGRQILLIFGKSFKSEPADLKMSVRTGIFRFVTKAQTIKECPFGA
jgi:hypothetical protein